MTVDHPHPRRPVDYYLLWAVALVSLGLNLYLINMLSQARHQLAQAASQAALAVGDLRGVAFDYMVPISQTLAVHQALAIRQALPVDQTLPVSFTVAFQQTFSVPISVTLPIDTQVTVSLNTPIGNFPITVPVKTT